MTKGEALKLVTYIVAAYPRPEVAPETIEVYVANLVDLPYDDTKAAVGILLRQAKFLPAIAEIRSAYTDHVLRKVGLLTAGEAWEVVQWAFWKVGQYRPFPDTTKGGPLLKRAVTAIGWQNLCNSENLVADRAHFFRVYEALVGRERERLTLDPHAQIGGAPVPVLQLVSADARVEELVTATAAKLGADGA